MKLVVPMVALSLLSTPTLASVMKVSCRDCHTSSNLHATSPRHLFTWPKKGLKKGPKPPRVRPNKKRLRWQGLRQKCSVLDEARGKCVRKARSGCYWASGKKMLLGGRWTRVDMRPGKRC